MSGKSYWLVYIHRRRRTDSLISSRSNRLGKEDNLWCIISRAGRRCGLGIDLPRRVGQKRWWCGEVEVDVEAEVEVEVEVVLLTLMAQDRKCSKTRNYSRQEGAWTACARDPSADHRRKSPTSCCCLLSVSPDSRAAHRIARRPLQRLSPPDNPPIGHPRCFPPPRIAPELYPPRPFAGPVSRRCCFTKPSALSQRSPLPVATQLCGRRILYELTAGIDRHHHHHHWHTAHCTAPPWTASQHLASPPRQQHIVFPTVRPALRFAYPLLEPTGARGRPVLCQNSYRRNTALCIWRLLERQLFDPL